MQALVLLAPGHVPARYYTFRQNPVRARKRGRGLKAGHRRRGDSRERFYDINQGKQLPVITTAKDYLSYFDPASDADMGVSAPRIPAATPVLTVVGDEDGISSVRPRLLCRQAARQPQKPVPRSQGQPPEHPGRRQRGRAAVDQGRGELRKKDRRRPLRSPAACGCCSSLCAAPGRPVRALVRVCAKRGSAPRGRHSHAHRRHPALCLYRARRLVLAAYIQKWIAPVMLSFVTVPLCFLLGVHLAIAAPFGPWGWSVGFACRASSSVCWRA